MQCHIAIQDLRSARFHDNLPKLDPGSPGSRKFFLSQNKDPPGSHSYNAMTGSKISKIPRENQNQDPKSFNISDPGSWGSKIPDLLGYWHMSGASIDQSENGTDILMFKVFFLV